MATKEKSIWTRLTEKLRTRREREPPPEEEFFTALELPPEPSPEERFFTALELEELPEEHDIRQEMSEVYSQALKSGSVEVSYGRIMLIGLGAAGKTSLIHGLMNQQLPDRANSTILASTRSVKYYWIKTEKGRYSHWTELSIEDNMQEVAQAAMSSNVHHVGRDQSMSCQESVNKSDQSLAQYRENVVEEMVESKSCAPKNEVLLHIWDCGGQPVFLSVLPAFLSSRTVFLLVFDASLELDDPCKVIVNIDGHSHMKETLDISALSLLQMWMASIHARFGGGGEAQLPSYPRIILVGTHADKLRSDQSKEKCLDKILPIVKEKYFSDILMDELEGVIVDNTTAGMGEREDKGIGQLRETIHEFVRENLSKDTPVSWVEFRNVLQLYVGKPVVQLDEVYRCARKCSIPREEVPSALNFYHELGVLLFYPSVHGLESVVILEPQWLVDVFGTLFCKWKYQDRHKKMCAWFSDYGVLTEPLYNEVLRPLLKGTNVTPDAVLNLLQKFQLAANIEEVIDFAETNSKQYFVPLMLKHNNGLGTVDVRSPANTSQSFVKRASPLQIVFSSGYVPPGFFVRLATCLSSEKGVIVLFRVGIWCNKITMRVNGKVDKLIITEYTDTVEIQFFRKEESEESFRMSCRNVFMMLQRSFTSISEWLPKANPQLAFCCTQCIDPAQMAFFRHHQDIYCKFSQKQSVIDYLHCKHDHSFKPTHSQQYWLCPIDKDSKHVSKDENQLQIAESLTRALNLTNNIIALAKELEMMPATGVVPDDLIERFYNSGGDTVELAQSLRAIKLKPLADKLISGDINFTVPDESQSKASTPSVIDYVRAVSNVTDWHPLGLHLDLTMSQLRKIESIHRNDGVDRMKAEMLHVWQKCYPDASWKELIIALKDMNENSVANKIEEKYCPVTAGTYTVPPPSHAATYTVPPPSHAAVELRARVSSEAVTSTSSDKRQSVNNVPENTKHMQRDEFSISTRILAMIVLFVIMYCIIEILVYFAVH